jgi:hypothetical protein
MRMGKEKTVRKARMKKSPAAQIELRGRVSVAD